MSFERELNKRANVQCELSGATENLHPYLVPDSPGDGLEHHILVSATCLAQLTGEAEVDPNHWRCLNDSMWSEVEAVKVVAWRMLHKLKAEQWPLDLLDMMYMEDETLTWAKASGDHIADEDKIIHRDSNGAVLQNGDSVTIIKDLNVKGSSLVAKRGTAVRNITLVHDNPEQIEGKVDGQHIVILTQYVKK